MELSTLGHEVEFASPRQWLESISNGSAVSLLVVGKILETRAAQDQGPIFGRVIDKISQAVSAGTHVVADFCDDYFDHATVGTHWRSLARMADVCIAATPALAERVALFAHAPVRVIGDPLGSPAGQAKCFEQDKQRPSNGILRMLARKASSKVLRLIWYGGTSNWPPMCHWAEELAALRNEQPFVLTAVTKTNFQILSDIQAFNQRYAPNVLIEHVEWAEDIQWKLVADADIVLVPSDLDVQTKVVKSANRIADALNVGRYVIATPLPAYMAYKGSVNFMQSPLAAVRHYLADPAGALTMIERGMVLARELGDVRKVGADWAEALALATLHERNPSSGEVISDGPGGETAAPTSVAARSVPSGNTLRIAVLSVSLIPTVQLRFELPFEGRSGDEPEVELLLLTEQELNSRFGKDRISEAAQSWLLGSLAKHSPTHLVFCRYSGPHAGEILSWCREHRIATLLHIDDDLFDLPDNFDPVKLKFHRDPQRVRTLLDLANGVDLVHTANSEMVDRLRSHGISNDILALTIPCGADICLPPAESDIEEFRIGYMGGGDHSEDLKLAADAIARVLDEFPKVVFELFGPIAIPAKLSVFGARVRWIQPVAPYRDFLSALAARRWHVGLCPLHDSRFNRAKTHIKWVEYTSVGAAVVASRGTIYDQCCSNGQGLLVDNDSSAWYSALSLLIREEASRIAQIQRAQRLVTARYGPDKLRREMLDALSMAVTLQRSKVHATDVGAIQSAMANDPVDTEPIESPEPALRAQLQRQTLGTFVAGGFGDYGAVYTTRSRYTTKERRDLFDLLPKGFSAASLLEVGCADGRNLRFFSERLGIDSDKTVGVDICRHVETTAEGLSFHHASAEEFFGTCNDRYDLILLSDILEHIYNPWALLRKIRQHLSSSGLLLLSVPNFQNLGYVDRMTTGDFQYESTGLMDETHIRFFSQNTLTRYLKEAGFAVLGSSWRPDGSLMDLRTRVARTLVGARSCRIELAGGMSVNVTRDDLDRWFGQQILLCAKPV